MLSSAAEVIPKRKIWENAFIMPFFFYSFDLNNSCERKGREGRGGVFATPAEVELPKTVHSCRATSTFENASSKFLRDVPFLAAEPDSPHSLAGVASSQPRPLFPSPTTMFAQPGYK